MNYAWIILMSETTNITAVWVIGHNI